MAPRPCKFLEDPGKEHTIKQLKSMICQTVAYVKTELKRYVDTAHDSDRLHVQVCEAGVFRVVPSVVVLFKALRSDGTTRYPCHNGKAIIKLAEVPAAIVHMHDLVGNQFLYADFAAGAALVPVEKHILSVISISKHATQPGQFVDEFLCATEHVNIGISRKSGAQASLSRTNFQVNYSWWVTSKHTLSRMSSSPN